MTYAEWAQSQDWAKIQGSQPVQWAQEQQQQAMEELKKENQQNVPAAEDDGSAPSSGPDVTVPSLPTSPTGLPFPTGRVAASSGGADFLPYMLIGGALILGVIVMVVMK